MLYTAVLVCSCLRRRPPRFASPTTFPMLTTTRRRTCSPSWKNIALDRHPLAVYLARLAPSSRRTMRAALDGIARLLSDDRCDAWSLDWPQLRYRHTTAVRALLADGRYAPSTANRHPDIDVDLKSI